MKNWQGFNLWIDSTRPVKESSVGPKISGCTQQEQAMTTTLSTSGGGGGSSWWLDVSIVTLRSTTCLAAWMAFYLTMTAKETKTFDMAAIDITEVAEWQDASAFSFLFITIAVVASYAVLTTMMAILFPQTKSKPAVLLWAVFFVDLGMSYVLISAVAASTAVAIIAKNGNSPTNWQPICQLFQWFCDRMQWARLAASLAFFTLVEATILDIYCLVKYQIASMV